MALVPFGSSAATANLNATPGGTEQAFVKPVDDANGNRTADLVEAAGSMTQGRIGVFSSPSVGTGTNFDSAVVEMLRVKDRGAFTRTVALFLSDGESSMTPSTLSTSSGAEVRTFVIGAGTGCQADADSGARSRVERARPVASFSVIWGHAQQQERFAGLVRP